MKKNRKKKLFMLGCLSLLLISTIYAVWTGKLEHTNELKADKTSARIEEVFEKGSQPSGTVKKEVSFENSSSNAVFLRVSYAETWQKEENGNKILLNNQVDKKDVATKHWQTGFGETSELWTDGGDGWFYYNKILKPGTQTEAILKDVSFPDYSGTYKDYENADYQLYFRMELLQASDSQSTLNQDEVNKKASKTVFGKEAVVSGETVSWK